MKKGERVDLISICHSLPEFAMGQSSMQYIHRDNILDTIDTILEENELINIEGEEGQGKTTLLVQFAQRHPKNTLSLFIKPSNRLGYDPDILKYDMCCQLNWFFNHEPLKDIRDADDVYLRNHLMRLVSYARKYNEIFYFLIDGLDEIPQESSHVKDIIFDMIPFGYAKMRFIITGNINLIPINRRRNIINMPYYLTGFTLDEAERYFGDLSYKLDTKQLHDIYITCRRKPGHLATVKRILNTGINIESFISQMSNELRDLFDIEWRCVSENEQEIKALSILAFSNKACYINDIASLLSINEDSVIEMLSKFSFIIIDSDNGNEISFITNAFRSYTADKLKNYKSYVNDLFIESLLKEPDSDKALTLLPGYLD